MALKMSRLACLITHSVLGGLPPRTSFYMLIQSPPPYAMNLTHPLLGGWMAACTSEETHPRPQKPSPYTVIYTAYNCPGEFRSG